MFNFGFFEWIVIFVIAIIFIKPSEYATVAKKCFKFIKKIENSWKRFTNEFDLYDS